IYIPTHLYFHIDVDFFVSAYMGSRRSFNMATNIEDDDVNPFHEYLAKEILQDFLVKSLLRFRCVPRMACFSFSKKIQMLIMTGGNHPPCTPLPPSSIFHENGWIFYVQIRPFTSNYKVIWVRQFWDDNYDGMFHRSYAAIYSSSIESWRILKHKHHKILTIYGDVYSIPNTPDYLYYWMFKAVDCCSLLSFEFSNEMFNENRGPDVPVNDCHMILRDGSINLFAQGLNTCFALWIMIQPGTIFCGFWDSTTVIFLIETSGMISYDVYTQKTRHLGFQHQGEGHISGYMVYYYKESLPRYGLFKVKFLKHFSVHNCCNYCLNVGDFMKL
ncbi:hypothetical protein H5410_021040, partial [Solanum commersonii]